MTTNSDDTGLQNLKDIAPGDVLTAEDVETLQRIIKIYQGLVALGWIGASIRNIILVVMTLIAAYAAVTGALSDWVKKLAGVE